MKKQFTNPEVQKLIERAHTRLLSGLRNFPDDLSMIHAYAGDYCDLYEIAKMIEKEEPKDKIAKAMWKLDTIVRDEIPDVLYYLYTR